jgi:hypothetical protein
VSAGYYWTSETGYAGLRALVHCANATSVYDLADRAKVAQSLLYMIVTGSRRATESTIAKIAKVTHLRAEKVAELLTPRGES